MKRYVKSNTKFESPEDLIYIGPVSDYNSYAFGYGHSIDSYSDEFKEAVTEIVNKQKRERNKKGLDLRNYTNKAEDVIKDLTNPYNHTSYPDEVLENADIFDGEYYIDYTDLYKIIEDHGASNNIDNLTKLIKSSPYYIAKDSDEQYNLIPNQVILDMISAVDFNTLDIEYINHNIEYWDYISHVGFTFYPVDKASAMKMQKVIDTLVWSQDITDYILSQEEILWRE